MRPEISPVQLAALRTIGRVGTGLRASEVGFGLIRSGHITPTRTRISPQAAALMVVRHLHKLERLGLIHDRWRGDDRIGYVMTTKGNQALADSPQEASDA